MLGALASLPAVVVAGAMAGTREEFSAGLARKPQLMGFATARAEVFNAPMTTLRGYLPSGLTGVLWRNGPAEHERFGHRYGHWFDGDGMVQAFAFSGDKVTPPSAGPRHAEAPAGDPGGQAHHARLRNPRVRTVNGT